MLDRPWYSFQCRPGHPDDPRQKPAANNDSDEPPIVCEPQQGLQGCADALDACTRSHARQLTQRLDEEMERGQSSLKWGGKVRRGGGE